MGRATTRSIFCLVPIAMLFVGFTASAAIMVDFENDLAPVNVPNGFMSSDSSLIHFSDTIGSDLIVLEVDGSHALSTFFDDDSALLMEFDFVASALSLEIGNALLANFGDTAVLTVLLGGVVVDSAAVVLNGTNAIDQTISYAGSPFDSAILKYNVAGGLTEVVDNIEVTQAAPTIPEPGAGYLFGMGALLVGAVCGRRSPAEVERHAMHG
jgi:hypothetical protein